MVSLFTQCNLDLGKGKESQVRVTEEELCLHKAVRAKNVPVVQALLKAGEDITRRDSHGKTPLHWAAENKNEFEGVSRRLRLIGGDKGKMEKNVGQVIINWVADKEKNLQIINYLLTYVKEKSINAIDIPDNSSYTPLHIAVRKDNIEIVIALLAADANVNAQVNNNVTPLHVAAGHGYIEIAELLIKKGADVNAETDNGETPLHWVAECGKLGKTPCGLNAMYGSIEVFKLLVDRGANVKAETKEGATPLHNAAEQAYPNLIQILLTAGVDVHAKDKYGNTPLHKLAHSTSQLSDVNNSEAFLSRSFFERIDSAIKELVEGGASKHIKNNFSKTPFQIAEESRLSSAKRVLHLFK